MTPESSLLLIVLLVLFVDTCSSSSVGLALRLSGKENDLDVNMTRIFRDPEPQGNIVDFSWCVRLSFESLHTQQIYFGNNTGLYFAKVRHLCP